MWVVIALCTLGLLALVVLVVSGPLRAARSGGPAEAPGPEEEGARLRRDELQAAREAKYREIRDLELDYRTGKLSEHDYRTQDALLRAEALEILDAVEAQGEEQGEGRP